MPDFADRILPKALATPRDRFTFLALAGSVAAALVSIAASQILLAAAVIGVLSFKWRSLRSLTALRPLMPALALFFAWTVLSALASSDIRLGLGIVKKFYIFLLIPLVPLVVRGAGRAAWIYGAVFCTAVVSSAAGLVQFAADPERDLLHRISGFMSQWMTYSGLLMLALVGLFSFALCVDWKRRLWLAPAGLLMFAAIYLSQTRSALLGAVAGMAVVLILIRPRAIVLMVMLLPAAYLVSPEPFRERFRTGWDADDPNTRNRIELFETSLRLIADNPWFGVGPKNVSTEALRYRGNSEYPDWMYQHMHNNALQVAAERGIPGMLLWLWLMARLAWDGWRLFRSSRECPFAEALAVAAAALGSWVALMAAGMFEYNFGDSEVLALFLFTQSALYAFLPEGRVEPGGPVRV